MLLDKYRPTSTRELLNSRAAGEVKKFLEGWKKGRALLVHGPTGCGKTAAIRLAASEGGYDLVEVHADDRVQMKDLMQASVQQGVFSKKRLILFENLGMSGRLQQLIKTSMHPVAYVIDDAYKLAPSTRSTFKVVKFERISDTALMGFAESVSKNEKIGIQRRNLEQLVRISNGDVRALLIDMEMMMHGHSGSGYRDSNDSIFNTLKIIFKTMSMENARIVVEKSDNDMEEIFRWLDRNIAEEYTDPKAIALAYDYLSKADIFRSRIIRRQSWSLQKYSSIAVYGTAIAKTRPSTRFTSYRPPHFFPRSNAMLGKIAGALHISKKQAADYLPILKVLAQRNSDTLEQLGLDESDLLF